MTVFRVPIPISYFLDTKTLREKLRTSHENAPRTRQNGGSVFPKIRVTMIMFRQLYYHVGKTQRTSSRLMTSIWSFLWKSSHSSLYLSISSLVWRIFFFSTSNSEPCCMVVMVNSRRGENTRPTNKTTGKPRTYATALVCLIGKKRENGVT